MQAHSSSSITNTIEFLPAARSLFIQNINSAFQESKATAKTALDNLIAQRRKTFIALVQRELIYVVTDEAADANNNPFIYGLSNLVKMIDPAKDIDDSQWSALIMLLDNAAPTETTASKDLKFYVLLRHELELLFPLRTYITNKSFDSLIRKLNKNQAITQEDCVKLFECLKKSLYFNGHEPVANEITKLIPTINLLLKTKLLTKTNLIRLMLTPSPSVNKISNNTREYYLPENYYYSPILSYDLTSMFIKKLDERKSLNQYNLEILFKVFAISIQDPDFPSKTSLLTFYYNISEAPEPFIFQQLTNFGTYRFNLTAEDQNRINELDPIFRDKLQSGILAEILQTMFNDALSMAEDEFEISEDNLPPLLTQYAKDVNLDASALHTYLATAKPELPQISQLLLQFHRDKLITEDTILNLIILAKSSTQIFKCYKLLRQYSSNSTPKEVLDTIITITPYIEAVNKMMEWLPLPYRNIDNFQLVLINARYAKDLLAVCNFELTFANQTLQILTDAAVTQHKIFLRNHNLGPILNPLNTIYNYISENQIATPLVIAGIQHLVNEMPSTLFEIAIELDPRFVNDEVSAETYFKTVIAIAEKSRKEWLEHISNLSSQDLSIVDATSSFTSTNYSFTGGDTYLEDENTVDASLATTNTSTPPHNVNTLLTEDEAILKLPMEYIERLTNSQANIPTVYVPNTIKAYQMLTHAGSLEHSLVEHNYEYAIEIAKAIANLRSQQLTDKKYIGLLEQCPQYAIAISHVICTLAIYEQLTDVNFILFRTQLNCAEIIAPEIDRTTSDNYRKCLSIARKIPLSQLITAAELEDFDNQTATTTATNPYVYAITPSSQDNQSRSNLASPSHSNLHISVISASSSSNDNSQNSFVSTELNTPTPATETTHLLSQARSETIAEEKPVAFEDLVERCRKDKRESSCYGRSNFLALVDSTGDNKISTIEQAKAYARNHPRSRTARVLLNMYAEQLPENDRLKRFLSTYLNEYKFGFFQRSELVPKMLNELASNPDITMKNITNHSNSNSSNRTSRIIKKGM